LTNPPVFPFAKGGIEEKGDFKASAKQDMLSTNTGAILFTKEVDVYLLFLEREDRREALD
jgi:hypothetical protein